MPAWVGLSALQSWFPSEQTNLLTIGQTDLAPGSEQKVFQKNVPNLNSKLFGINSKKIPNFGEIPKISNKKWNVMRRRAAHTGKVYTWNIPGIYQEKHFSGFQMAGTGSWFRNGSHPIDILHSNNDVGDDAPQGSEGPVVDCGQESESDAASADPFAVSEISKKISREHLMIFKWKKKLWDKFEFRCGWCRFQAS